MVVPDVDLDGITPNGDEVLNSPRRHLHGDAVPHPAISVISSSAGLAG
jgi:hypothetical protein